MKGVTRLCLAFVVAALFTQVHGISFSNIRETFLKPFHHSRGYGSQAKDEAASVTTKPRDDVLLATGPAGVVVAARQRLFDYGVGIAFTALTQRLQGQRVPDVQKSFSIPIVGSFELQLSDIVVTRFSANASNSRLQILDGFFHLLASDVAANLTFKWHWAKAGLSGSGDGELLLGGGTIDWVFDVHKDEALQKPQLQVVTASSNFDSVDLKIHSYSADWLYQAVLSLFNEAVRKQVQNGISSALDGDVPNRLNDILASLPTRIDVTGLPFSTTFEYSLYTSGFVLVKGYGEVQVDGDVPPAPAAAAEPGVELLERQREGQQRQQHASVDQPHLPHRALRAVQDIQEVQGEQVQGMSRCPFETSPLPLTAADIGSEPSMTSIYVHEATVNCLLWGLYNSGKLAFELRDGTVPGLTITTDVLALLVPELPTLYPHQRLNINVQALDSPRLSFSAASGTTVSAWYRMALVVANDTLGNPEVVRLAANLTVSGAFDWDSITITDVTAHHVIEASQLAVPAEKWDNTVVWLLQNYGSLASLRQVVEAVVRTPVASLVDLQGAHAATWDRWYGMSADVEVRLPPSRR